MFKLRQGFKVYGEDCQRYIDSAERKLDHILDCSRRSNGAKVSITFLCDDSALSFHHAATTDHITMLNSFTTTYMSQITASGEQVWSLKAELSSAILNNTDYSHWKPVGHVHTITVHIIS